MNSDISFCNTFDVDVICIRQKHKFYNFNLNDLTLNKIERKQEKSSCTDILF